MAVIKINTDNHYQKNKSSDYRSSYALTPVMPLISLSPGYRLKLFNLFNTSQKNVDFCLSISIGVKERDEIMTGEIARTIADELLEMGQEQGRMLVCSVIEYLFDNPDELEKVKNNPQYFRELVRKER